MPFFSPKTWKQRIVEFPGRRRLDDTSSADVYDVSRAEGTVTQEGDGFTAANMNDLEQRINNAVNDVAGLSADEYDPNATYSSGDLRIHDNILHKANQDISVAEAWTPAHWDATTIAAELKAQAEDISDLNSSLANFPDGDYIAPFRYDGYNSGPFLFLPKYIIDNYDISAESFDSMGYFAAVSVDGFITLNNGILFYHTWDEYRTDYSGIMCEIHNVTFTPKS